MSESKVRTQVRSQDTAKDGEPEFRLRPRPIRSSMSENRSLTGLTVFVLLVWR